MKLQEKELIKNYKKSRWFFTSSGKIVIGGKSAIQNDILLRILKHSNKDYIVMHTSNPGSPFSVIISDIDKVTKKDIEESAIFTGCFSKAWRAGKKTVTINIFKLSQIYKIAGMKEGTWGVMGRIKDLSVNLELALTKQKGVLRAVPIIAIKNKKDILIKICPGKIEKQDMIAKLQIELDEQFTQEEILSALPAGGIKILR